MALLVAAIAALAFTGSAAHGVVAVDDTPKRTWQLNDRGYATLYVGSTVYVGGAFTTATSPTGTQVSRPRLAAFDAVTGDLRSTSWSLNGTVRALASDGTYLYVAGAFTSVNGTSRSRVARLKLSTGALDTTWKVSLNAVARALTVANGSVYIGGNFTSVNGVERKALVKVSTSSGTAVVDNTFAPRFDRNVYGLTASSTTLYAAGDFTSANGQSRNGLAGLDRATGANRGPAFKGSATALGVDVDDTGGRVFLAEAGGANAAEAFDTGTGKQLWNRTAMGDVQAIRFHDGDVYFGFHEGYGGDTSTRMKVVAAGNGAFRSFDPDFVGFYGVYAIDVNSQGVVIGGSFTSVSGVAARNWALF